MTNPFILMIKLALRLHSNWSWACISFLKPAAVAKIIEFASSSSTHTVDQKNQTGSETCQKCCNHFDDVKNELKWGIINLPVDINRKGNNWSKVQKKVH